VSATVNNILYIHNIEWAFSQKVVIELCIFRLDLYECNRESIHAGELQRGAIGSAKIKKLDLKKRLNSGKLVLTLIQIW
jgi:hypothetical protein